jgi:integrase
MVTRNGHGIILNSSRQIESRAPLCFDEYMAYLHNIEPWFQPMAEIGILTGMTLTEMVELTVAGIQGGILHIRNGSTKSRKRKIRITPAIQRVLDILVKRTGGDGRLMTLKGGKVLTHAAFYKAWCKAEKLAMLPNHRGPYALRYSFAAWALVLGIDKIRLGSLMGSQWKVVIFEADGKSVEGLEEDRHRILEYFGEDFIAGK